MEEMNLKRIAQIAHVNHSTVSRALHGSPVVKPSTRERILEIARAHHYVPNEIARSLKTKKTRIIGLIVSDIKNPFFHRDHQRHGSSPGEERLQHHPLQYQLQRAEGGEVSSHSLLPERGRHDPVPNVPGAPAHRVLRPLPDSRRPS